MKICDITDAYHSTSGGIRTYLDEKARYIQDSTDHEHMLIIPADRDFHEGDGRREVFGVRSPVIPGCAPYRVMLRQGRIRAILDRARPDVIELGNAYMQPRAARSFRRRYGAVLAGFYHTDFPSAYVETPLRGRVGTMAAGTARRAATRYARHVHARLDLTLVGSPALETKLKGWGVPGVEEVSLGVDLEMFHPERRDLTWRRELGVDDEDRLLIFAGRIDREKRVDVLVEMMDRLPAETRCRLALMGQGPRWSQLKRATADDPRVHMLPFERDRERFARALASADIYVSAARFETFGLSVIEAQAAGLPVVGQRAGAMVERVPGSVGVLVDELDPEAMATAVASVTGERGREMGRAARRLVESKHSWETTFERLFDLYAKRLRANAEPEHARQPA